uniref:Stearoyl-[acyl-carrier-protein] 9-desaturase, chloroplastic-like n=1 Tax=Nelumbo nucifera TaxID=4432 RepID=A0A822XYU4_NELNU|nr:TPA_asm: hypothetical protein HUJ06_026656 [Nelumbo nucifera]
MALKLDPLSVQSQKFTSFGLPSVANLRSPRVYMASTLRSSTKEVENLRKPFSPPREVHVQVTHSMPPQNIEIFKSMEDWAEQNVLVHLKPVEKCWQPQDFLPDPSSEGFYEQVKELRERSKEIPDDYFVVLVGDMITEEALPTYQTMLNTLDGVRDETGASLTSWAVWTRAWTAEENRHGDLLNKYLYLTGRVDMKQIEKTIQYLIGSGMVLLIYCWSVKMISRTYIRRYGHTCKDWCPPTKSIHLGDFLGIQGRRTTPILGLSTPHSRKELPSSRMGTQPGLPRNMET